MSKLLVFLGAICFYASALHAQVLTVRGKAVDEQGAVIPFVSVKIKGSRGGTVADADGVFSLKAKQGDVLILSSAGYDNKQATVTGSGTLVVTLAKTSQELAAVVVTALGIKREARSLGYATAQIDNKDLNASQPVNFANGITGKVSGMNVDLTNSGVDPDNIRITLRGNRSFLGNNEPLLVVDGVPVDISYLAEINSADIASVNVLKGATAAALYGSSAANGVMVVTTRMGSRKPTIQLSSTVTFDRVSFFPKMQYYNGPASSEYSSTDAISYSNPANNQNGYVPFENQSFASPYASGSPWGGDSVIIGFPGPDGQVQKIPYEPLADEIKKFWKTGATYQNGISYSQGDDNGSYFLSGQNIKKTGITPGDTYNRTTVRFNGSKRYGAFKATGNVSYGESNLNQAGSLYNTYYQVQNIATSVPFTNYANSDALFGDINTYYNAYALNPYWYIDNDRYTRNRQDLLANGDLSLDATKWLNIDYQLGIENYSYYEQTTVAALNFSPYAFYLASATLAGNESVYVGDALPSVSTDNVTDRKIYSNFKATLHKSIGNFGGQLILGNTINQEKQNYLLNGSTTLLNISGLYNVNFRSGTPSVNQYSFLTRNYGNYADLTLNYKDWAFIHASGRQDKTSLLNAANRSYFYPGVDASLVLSDVIPDVKNSRVISYIKIRGGVTKTGNLNVNPYQIQNVQSAGPGFPYGQTTGLTTSSTYANNNLKPEFTLSNEVGAEIAFLHNRFDLQGTYFYEKTTDETVSVSVSDASGYQSYLENVGRMDNRGLELDLKANILRLNNGLRWDVGLHYTHYKNVAVDLGPTNSLFIPSVNQSNAYAVKGNPYPVLQVPDWNKDSLGRVIVNANTGLPSVNSTLVNFGATNPTHTLGINTSVSFKGFTLGAVAEYRGGNVIYNGTGTFLDVDGLSARSAMFQHSRFVYPNSVIEVSPGKYVPNTNVTINDGGVGFWGNFGYFPPSMFITSAAFWSLRNVSLTYDLPKSALRRLKVVQGIQIGIVGSNLLLFLPKLNTWQDPEFSEDKGNATGTNSINEAPPTRTYGANLNITF
ncbi:MAG TPA: SusC/RagA family TonB-linked outer membrane protein [Dinghuibacter sp.]|uniref:SusC/RagA family TonB-linked outer membrane protein n=1 Tax=Dinghuibacter sp. TaxID=2024697 RepID=UPI002C51B480|nr:SusC/RagA family TonB-linked outer membrane protein [Dinghuibacter sp.]HTJ13847.1 SusC/RagA family TonB-linked outer membrane protein [Dinghuibacter sp.]